MLVEIALFQVFGYRNGVFVSIELTCGPLIHLSELGEVKLLEHIVALHEVVLGQRELLIRFSATSAHEEELTGQSHILEKESLQAIEQKDYYENGQVQLRMRIIESVIQKV